MEKRKTISKKKMDNEGDKLSDEVSMTPLVRPESIVLAGSDMEALSLLFGVVVDKLDIEIRILKDIRDGKQNQEPK